MCATCIFRPGNLMHLNAGRVRGMVDAAKAENTAIVCHETYEAGNAVCRGFFDRHEHEITALEVAARLEMIRWV